MRVRSTSPLALTYALLHSAAGERTVSVQQRAMAALSGRSDAVAIDGLLDVLDLADAARPMVQAIEMLRELDHPAIDGSLVRLLRSRWPAVQAAAIVGLQRRGFVTDTGCQAELFRLLAEHSSWTLRRAALRALSSSRDSRLLIAGSDPHWRVRHALVQLLRERTPEEVQAAIQQLSASTNPQSQGVARYLQSGSGEQFKHDGTMADRPPFWDDDAAVLERNLRAAAERDDVSTWTWLPELAAHEEECVHRFVCQLLLRAGTPQQLSAAANWLHEPRLAAYPALVELFARIDRFRCAETVELIRSDSRATPGAIAWASEQAGRQTNDAQTRKPAATAVPPDNETHPRMRAAALTPQSAAALLDDPERETSWQVLAAACRIMRRPLWELAPDPAWQPPEHVVVKPTFALSMRQPAQARVLGPEQTPVSALALSGHYHLPSEGFAIGVDHGVNLFFWEPNYDSLTTFSRGVAANQRQQLRFIAGTFEATPQGLRRDAERALRVLHIDRLELFLLFWTRNWERLDDSLRTELDRLQQTGLIRTIGMSTHNRGLAVEAIEQNWNPVMVRHSAAHRGAEQSVFPAAIAKGTSLLAFNSTCYGRLLKPSRRGIRLTAADCYRYTLSQPAVTSCLCAPATLEQLRENLAVLAEPDLAPGVLAQLLEVGDEVYREDTAFRQHLR